MSPRGTVREVSCRVTPVLDSFAKRAGTRLEDLAADLPVSVDRLRDPAERMDWDVFAALFERVGERLGLDQAEALGREVVHMPAMLASAQAFVSAVASPRRLYQAGCSWLARAWFWNLRVELRDLGPGRLEIRAEIPATYAPAPWYFRHVTGTLSAIPRLLGLPDADVVADTHGYGGTWLVSVPSAPLRTKLALLPRALRAFQLVEELGRQQRSLNAAFMENVRAAHALGAAERRFQALLAGIVEVICIIDGEETLRYVTPSVAAALGYSPEELTGTDAFALVHPDDAPRLRASFAAAAERPGAAEEASLRIRRRDGSWADFEVTLRDLRDDSEISGFVVNARNVSDKRRAEARLREQERAYSALLSNVHGMAYRCRNDDAWTMELVSDGCERVTGYAPDELRDNAVVAFSELIVQEDRAPLWEKCQANLAARLQCSNEYRIRTKGGEVRWVWDLAHGIYSDSGELLCIEGLVTDITDRRRLEEQLLQAQKMEGIGRLAGGIAHDFNNLLAVMQGCVGLALGELPADHPARRHIEPIADAGRRASDLTRQLLTFARRQVIEPRALDPNQVVEGISSLLARVLGDHIELEVSLDRGVGSVRADAAQLEQVLMNLAINARDAMADGGRLGIATESALVHESEAREFADAVPGPHVVVSVTDTGTGLSPEAREHLFEPFFTTKPVGHGTGLGLATSYGIVKQAGGHIRVESEPGRGTSFRIYLPASPRPAPPPETAPAEVAIPGGETILVVEDHDLVRGLVTRALAAFGYAVLSADGGQAALSLAAAHAGPIHLLLTDVTMPKMGGPELARELCRVRPGLKVLFTSGLADTAVAKDGVLDAGVAFLAKPFTMSTLLDKVHAALRA
ncbi:MAG: PAS domain S-box protein [Myxococcales bacterium]|nr:PAS domain S-box protein [Myxococcales bacterium]